MVFEESDIIGYQTVPAQTGGSSMTSHCSIIGRCPTDAFILHLGSITCIYQRSDFYFIFLASQADRSAVRIGY